MKNLLILNGSHSDISLIEAGKELGYHVITTGNRPDLIGHQYSDEYVYGDFSKPDEIYELFRNRNLDAVCACANDFGAITAAYLSDKLNLPGHDSYETTLILHHKDRFKAFCREYDIHTPYADGYDDESIALDVEYEYPVIVKPIDLTGGKGVGIANDKESYCKAVKYAFMRSPHKKIVVEPYINGTYHSFSIFLVGQRVRAYFSDNEYSYLNNFLVSTSGGPASNVDKVSDILINDSEKIANVLNLRDGIFHIQYVMTKDYVPYILEITRRCSGDFYSTPVQHALGIDWAKWIVRTECGMSAEYFPKDAVQKGFTGRHCIMGDRNGVVKDVYISPEIQNNIYSEFTWWKPGFVINDYLTDKLGVLFLEYRNEEDMLNKIERITDLVKVIYE